MPTAQHTGSTIWGTCATSLLFQPKQLDLLDSIFHLDTRGSRDKGTRVCMHVVLFQTERCPQQSQGQRAGARTTYAQDQQMRVQVFLRAGAAGAARLVSVALCESSKYGYSSRFSPGRQDSGIGNGQGRGITQDTVVVLDFSSVAEDGGEVVILVHGEERAIKMRIKSEFTTQFLSCRVSCRIHLVDSMHHVVSKESLKQAQQNEGGQMFLFMALAS